MIKQIFSLLFAILLWSMTSSYTTNVTYKIPYMNKYHKVSVSDYKFIYNLASKYVKPNIAIRYTEVILIECKIQNFPFPRKIALQVEKESRFKHSAKSKINGEYFAHGSMQLTRFQIERLYWLAKDRKDKKLHDALIKIERETKFTQKNNECVFYLRNKKDKTDKQIVRLENLLERRKKYVKRCTVYFRRIGYSIACGVRTMKTLYKTYDDYPMACLAYWAGQYSSDFRYWSKKKRIMKNPYITHITKEI